MNLDCEIIVRPLTKNEGGGWFAHYRDFKGVMGDGDSAEEALQDVRNAFNAFIQNALENKDFIPLPSSHKPKTVRLNITLPEDDLEMIDNYAKIHHMSRSGLLHAAAK